MVPFHTGMRLCATLFERILLLGYKQEMLDFGDFKFKKVFTYKILIIQNVLITSLCCEGKKFLPPEINKKINCVTPPLSHFSYSH
jgi:hypothetical protein